MDIKIRNYLGLAAIFALLVAGFSTASYVRSFSRSLDPNNVRSFTVTAEGSTIAVPDTATFTFGIITEGGLDVANLQKNNSEASDKILKYLNDQGVGKEDIKTSNYSIDPRYVFSNAGPSRIVGFTVNQSFRVKVKDFAKASDILAGVVERGANNVSQLSFDIEDRTKLEQKARKKAIENAKEKAKDIAGAGDFRLGQLLSIEESFAPEPIFRVADSFAGGIGGGGPGVEGGSQEINIVVTVRYGIE
ncbi:MAG: hypothetical protein COV31_00365 [Candidatus Yanofskybacteria bacterium CG10_big_fil_rev_8_21_14_0_10_46_23]|uniref:SIMPL domain-containing protein n=1 Tax=Candidatus Yanofskybacteria bacterium CG10_big_fil_rev_8_21_14_0_10_46_23 TaxID=1975098 RepID=A0A2H0R4V0_9BACT|nr:MAG: hypothetical protein COV31_00365 [Candidatus Yanofskybacteria bacterium CG10_big_fil_rev_8_21_14_0_10_46_23]